VADQQFERARREPGGRRSVADRRVAGDPLQRRDCHSEIAYLLLGRAQALVAVAVMADLVAGSDDLRDRVGIGVGGMARDEPGRGDFPLA
jgi:hypothetical protein